LPAPPSLTVANSVQYEPAYIILEDYPAGGKEIFKAGDRIMQVRHTVCCCIMHRWVPRWWLVRK